MRTDMASHPPPSMPQRRTRDREVRVGLFVVGGLVAAVALLFALTDASTFRGRYKVATRLPDAGGVRKGDPVQMRGVNIGRVKGFGIEAQGVQLTLEIEGEYRFPADSRVELASGGLLTGRVVAIQPGTSPQVAKDGAVLPGATGGEGALDQVGGMAEKAQRVLGQVEKLVSDQTVSNVGQSTESLAQMLAELRALTAEQRKEVGALSASLRKSAAGLERAAAGPELERSVQRLDRMTAQMEKTMSALDRSANSLEVVLARIERGEGTLGKLSRDESLYRNTNEAVSNLNRTAAELQTLVQDVKANPRRYINLEIF